jgi:hypothetical protein
MDDNMSHEEANRYVPYLELRIPRCAACSTEWCGKKSQREKKWNVELTRKCDAASVQALSFGELLLLPQCGCTHLKMVSSAPFRDGSYNNFFLKFEQTLQERLHFQVNELDAISDTLNHTLAKDSSSPVLSSIKTLAHNVMCKPCLERFLKASEQVETQEGTSTPFSTALNCPTCRRRYMSRELNNLLKEPSRIMPVLLSSTNKNHSKGRDLVSFEQYLNSTIQTVLFWKHIRKVVKRAIKTRQKNHRDFPPSDWEPFYTGYVHSSDSCFSSNDDDLDSVISDKDTHSCPFHLEMKPGELQQELMKKDSKYRQEVENEKLILSMSLTDLFGPNPDEARDIDYAQYLELQTATEEKISFQIQQDRILAEQLQQEVGLVSENEKLGQVDKQRHSYDPSLHTTDKKRRKMSDSDKNTWGDGSIGKKRHVSKKYSQTTLPSQGEKSSIQQKPMEENSVGEDMNESLKLLIDMGFSRMACECTLRDANCNVDLAVSMLLSEQSLKEKRDL